MPSIPSEEEWLEQTKKAREEIERLQVTEPSNHSPAHPIAQLQGPFEESIAESMNGAQDDWHVYIDAQTRRDQVLTAPKYERLCGRRWRQRSNEKYHPLWKLVAQISFGLHLLARGLAKSESAVIKILQVHVAELDGAIENTTEDIVLALSDIDERLRHLSLPLGNIPVFSDMLADQKFRQKVITDHERIGHIIRRTAVAMEDSVKDIEKGLQSVRILGLYLRELRAGSNGQPNSLDSVYDAMIGNVDGWKREFKSLKRNAYRLAISLSTLNQVAFEISRLAGIAPRNGSKGVVSHEDRHRKHIPNMPGRNGSIVSPEPLPYSPTDGAFTAEAQAVSIVKGITPVTLVQPNLRQDGPRRGSASPYSHQRRPSKKENKSNNNAGRYYTKRKTVRRSFTAPELSGSNTKNFVPGDRNGKQRHPKTSSSKVKEHSYPVPEKDSTNPFGKLSSRLDRFQKATSRFFSISHTRNNNNNIKQRTKVDVDQDQSFKPMEQSWMEFEPRDQQMGWSYRQRGLSEANTMASGKDSTPEFPHLMYMSFLEDQSSGDEEDPDTSLKSGQRNDQGSEITALPIMKDTLTISDSLSSQDDSSDMAAEVASTFSSRNRRFRTKNIHIPSLPKAKSGNSLGHVIYQNRHWLRQKPSTVFSFVSSKKGADEASLNSTSLSKSRQNSRTPEPQSRPVSSKSNKVHGLSAPPPLFGSTWNPNKGKSSKNIETPPLSPRTFFDPTVLTPTSGTFIPPSRQSSLRGSIADRTNSANATNPAKPRSSSQHERRELSTANRSKSSASLNITTTNIKTEKPRKGSLSLFPKTPTTPVTPATPQMLTIPRGKKSISASSLREVSYGET